MGIRDALLDFDATAVAHTDGSEYSANTIDIGTVDREIGEGEPMSAEIVVTVAAGAAGTETYTFSLISDSAEPLDASSVVISTLVVPSADLILGSAHYIDVPKGYDFSNRYLGMKYVLADGTGTATLSCTAHLVPRSFGQRKANSYAKGSGSVIIDS